MSSIFSAEVRTFRPHEYLPLAKRLRGVFLVSWLGNIAAWIKQFPLILLLIAEAALTMIRLNATLKLRTIGFSVTAVAAILIVLLASNSSTAPKVGPASPTLTWIISYLLIALFMFGISEIWFKRALSKQREKELIKADSSGEEPSND